MQSVFTNLKIIPVAERLQMMEKLWDSLEDADIPTPDWHITEIDRRIAAHGGKLEGHDLQVVLQELRARNGS